MDIDDPYSLASDRPTVADVVRLLIAADQIRYEDALPSFRPPRTLVIVGLIYGAAAWERWMSPEVLTAKISGFYKGPWRGY